MPDEDSDVARLQRPVAARTEPLRNMSSLLGAAVPAPANSAAAPAPANSAAAPAPANGATPAHGQSAQQADPQIAAGVNAGYRVIDEYLRQGQEAARAAWMGGVPGLGGVGGRGEAELAAMASQMLRYSSELASFWTGMLNNVSRPNPIGEIPRAPASPGGFDFGGPLRPPQPPTTEQPVAPSPQATAPQRVASAPAASLALVLAIDSKRPLEVSARLDPHGPIGVLRVHDLRAADEALPRLRNVRAEQSGASLRITVAVPDEQPAGVYSGVIVDDESNLPAGTISVRVLP